MSDLLNRVKYIEDSLYLKEIFNTPKQILGETCKIKEGYNTALFNYVYKEDGFLTVRQTLNSFLNIKKKISFVRIQDNTIPRSEDEYSVQRDETGMCRGMLFFKGLNNVEIEYDYTAIGKNYVSASNIYTSFTNKDNVLETLEDLIRSAREAIDICITIGDANILVTQLKQYIQDITRIINELIPHVAEGSELVPLLKDLILKSEIQEDELQSAIESARDIENLINSTGNPTFTIPTSGWKLSEDDHLYHYTLNHNLVSNVIVPSFTVMTDKGWQGCHLIWFKVDKNNIELLSEDNREYSVDISTRTYSGIDSFVKSITTDDIKEGNKNLYIKTETISLNPEELDLEDGLYVKSIKHNLSSSNIICTVRNLDGEELTCASKVVDKSNVKIYVYNQANMVVKISRIGVF